MLTVLHISDLHFGPPYVPAVGEALLRSAGELQADVIVASGDFTQRAKARQFADARKFLDRLPPRPLVVVPGNHDIPLYRVRERLFTPYALYRQYISAELDTVVRLEGAVIVALNTTDPLRAITNGRIERWQLDFCSEAFADAPAGTIKIVVAHHHFAPAPDYDSDSDVMPRGKEALGSLYGAGRRLDPGRPSAPRLHRQFAGRLSEQGPLERHHHRPVGHDDLAARPRPRAGKEFLQPDPGRRGHDPHHALHALSRAGQFRPRQPPHLSAPHAALLCRRPGRRLRGGRWKLSNFGRVICENKTGSNSPGDWFLDPLRPPPSSDFVSSQSVKPRRVAVVGGGITGLAAAHRLRELEPTLEVVLLEASDKLGGLLQTVRRDGYLIERTADNFITNVPWAVDLCRRIGFYDQLIPTNERHRQAFVVRRGRLAKVPQGFLLMSPSRLWPILTTRILSPLGKARLLAERFVPRRRGNGDESVASFARRRLGREAFERLVQPLVGGIYTADPEKLSMLATMPRFVETERRFGSLIRGRRAAAEDQPLDQPQSGPRYNLFMAPRDGMASLVEAIAARLPADCIRLQTRVNCIERQAHGWKLFVTSGMPGVVEEIDCDALVLALAAHSSAQVLDVLDGKLAADLAHIPHAGTTIVSAAYGRGQIAHPLDGFGFVVPAVERPSILAGSFSSVKFPGRAPADGVLIRVFVGGACQGEIADLPDERLRRLVSDELRQLLDISGEPIFLDVARWPNSMPQFHLGHGELVERIEKRIETLPGLAIAGNAYHGVGIPNCIHSGERAAEKCCRRASGKRLRRTSLRADRQAKSDLKPCILAPRPQSMCATRRCICT